MVKGLITEIQRYSTHEGPGVRTTVFLKGCQLECGWCHNPETIDRNKELMFYAERCIGCLSCLRSCPKGLHSYQNGKHEIDFSRCDSCGICADNCWTGALTICGKEVTVEDVIEEVEEDLLFYRNGGGITLSGGEPLLQPDFVVALLKECNARGIHTAVESNMSFPVSVLEKILPYVDLVICDIKMMDNEKHKHYTGMRNELLLQNIRYADKAGKDIIVRTPLIQGVNDDEANAEATADFLKGLRHLLYYEVLPYHPLGLSKSDALGKSRNYFHTPTEENIETFIGIVRSHHIKIFKGGIV